MKIITHYYDDVKHDTINCVPLFPVLNLWCEFEAHLTTKSFRSRDQSVRSRCSSHSAAQSHVAYSVQWICCTQIVTDMLTTIYTKALIRFMLLMLLIETKFEFLP